MNIREKQLVRAAATVWTLLSTSFVTDYLAALGIAAAPIMVAACRAVAHYRSLLSG